MSGSTWGRTQRAVYARDGWQCMMPVCVCPDGRALDRALLGKVAPWAPSVDHIVPRALGGGSAAWNLRAAHQLCNQKAGKNLGLLPARPKRRLQTVRRGTYSRRALGFPEQAPFPGNQGSRWS